MVLGLGLSASVLRELGALLCPDRIAGQTNLHEDAEIAETGRGEGAQSASRDQPRGDLGRGCAGEILVQALELEREPVVIEPELLQDRRVVVTEARLYAATSRASNERTRLKALPTTP